MRLSNLLAIAVAFFYACSAPEEKSEALAKKHCASCHAFPDPSLLDKQTWEKHVMPEMAFRMGLNQQMLWSLPQEEIAQISTYIPGRPMVSEEEWAAIKKYYNDNAPDSLESPVHATPQNLTGFKIEQYSLPSRLPAVTHIAFDSASAQFFIATRHAMLFQLDSTLQVKRSVKVESPVSFIDKSTVPWVMTGMGIMDPNDQPVGQLHSLSGQPLNAGNIIDSLRRPVHVSSFDFNKDQRMDYVISEFGNHVGKLTLYEATSTGFVPHVLSYLPGTRKTILADFDRDGVTDILALITQGDEKIVVYRGHGGFNFSPETLLQFPPVYGSSYFDFVDMNQDGHDDILYTNGDNLDYSQVLKPYHGIRIFLNNGKGKFTEDTFLPMHGASMAIARDFDGDADIDIAAISFFPDFANAPSSGFMLFENKGGTFEPRTDEACASARWLTMQSADIDHDGDEDLLLGAMNFTPAVPEHLVKKWQQANTSLLVLRNTRF